MALRQVLEIYEILDSPSISGKDLKTFFQQRGLVHTKIHRLRGKKGYTDFIHILIPGSKGKTKRGRARTLGVIGFLGGIGARPQKIGMVSDADGALTALSAALKLADMQQAGDVLRGDVIVTTHVCPKALMVPHHPAPFMASPVPVGRMIPRVVDPGMEAIVSVDTTRGNRILNRKGIAITPTVKEGYILKVSNDLLGLLEHTTGRLPLVLPITHQDITPYGNGVYHLNTIMQPSLGTKAPVIGLAITSETIIPGSATGASQLIDIEEGARFCIEVAKAFGEGRCQFYDPREFGILLRRYGTMRHLQGG